MNKLTKNNETNPVPTASSICGVKTEPATLKPMGNLCRHSDLLVLVISLLIRGMQMG
jgi:hypothetical protein